MNSDQQQTLINEFHALARRYPSLYPAGRPFVSLLEYLGYFQERAQQILHLFSPPVSYEFSLVEKYKDQIFNSGVWVADGGTKLPYTIFQLTPELHLYAVWAYSVEERFILDIDVYTKDPADFPKFLTENEAYQVRPVGKSAGFRFNENERPF